MKLKEIRENAGLSQSKLSKASGVNLRSIQAYEQGERNIKHASIVTVAQLATALNCTIDDLIKEDK